MTADAGSTVTLTVTASADPDDITYVWKKDGVIIPGETSNTLILNDVSPLDIGQYECIPVNTVGSHNSSIIQVDVECEFMLKHSCSTPNLLSSFHLVPGILVKVDSFEETSISVAPAAPSGYTCTPPIPQGELTTSGTLMISTEFDTSDEGEYRCVSDDFTGAVVIYLDGVGM